MNGVPICDMATNLIINEIFDPHLSIEKEDFPDLCRVCMGTNKNMKSLFNTELCKTADEFEFCTGITISQDDGLPTSMCDMCLDNLSVAHKFKNACLSADKIFKKILSKQVLLSSIDEISFKQEVTEKTDALNTFDDSNCPSQDLLVTKSEEIDINWDNTTDDDCFYRQDDEIEAKPTRKLRSATKCHEQEKKGQKLVEVETKHTCEVCGLKYLSRPLLMKHKLKVHGRKSKNKPNSKKTTVKKVKEVHKNKVLRKIIEQDVTKDQIHSCNVCQLNFQSRNSMLEHKLRECKEWVCEVCGKQFGYLSSFNSHVRCHQPPSYNCSHCDYSTSHKSDLAKHLRTHTGEKNYVCEYCTQSFHTISNMYDHIRRNHRVGGIKVHKCPRCNRSFAAKAKLKIHIDSHDNVKRHECNECHARFSRRCLWKKHLQKQHSIIVPRMRPGRRKTSQIVSSDDVAKTSIKTRKLS